MRRHLPWLALALALSLVGCGGATAASPAPGGASNSPAAASAKPAAASSAASARPAASAAAASTAASPSAQLTPIKIEVTTKSASYLYLYAAQDLGIFQKHGLTAQIIPMAPPAAIAAIQSGELDMMGAIGSATRADLSGGLDLRVILVGSNRPSHELIGAKGITSVQQLKGKVVIGYTAQDTVNVMTTPLLTALGLQPDQYQVLNAGADEGRTAALMNGAGAATLIDGDGALPLLKQGFPLLAKASDYIEVPLSGLATSTAQLQKKNAVMKQAVAAVLEALNVTATQKDQMVPLMIKEFGYQPDDASNIYDGLKPGWAVDGKPTEKAIQFEFQTDQAALNLKTPIDRGKIYDFSLLGQPAAASPSAKS